MKILLVFNVSHSFFKYQHTAYIAGEPTMCLAPGHGATAFRQDWDIQDGMAVDELPLSERIKLLHFLHHIFTQV